MRSSEERRERRRLKEEKKKNKELPLNTFLKLIETQCLSECFFPGNQCKQQLNGSQSDSVTISDGEVFENLHS